MAGPMLPPPPPEIRGIGLGLAHGRQRKQGARLGLGGGVPLVGMHQHVHLVLAQFQSQRRAHHVDRHQRPPALIRQARHQPFLNAPLPGAKAAPRQGGGGVQADAGGGLVSGHGPILWARTPRAMSRQTCDTARALSPCDSDVTRRVYTLRRQTGVLCRFPVVFMLARRLPLVTCPGPVPVF